jgi:hypothetical protein
MRKIFLFIIILFTILVENTNNVLAQQKIFDGKYVLNDKMVGDANFEYILSKTDTIFNGFFYFNKTEKDSAKENFYNATELNGYFQKGEKQGSWIYRFMNFTESNQPIIRDKKIQYSVSGNEFFINSNFKSGKANGKWEAGRQSVENSNVYDTLFYTTTNFKDGIAVGELTSYSPQIKIKGSFDNDGFLDGNWSFIHFENGKQKIKEYRFYKNGVFKNHYFVINKDTLFINQIGLDTNEDSEDELWTEIPLSSEYFKIIFFTNFGINETSKSKYKLSKDSTDKFINGTNTFLEKTLFSFSNYKNENVWQFTSGSNSVKLASFKVRKFTFDKTEIELNKTISENYTRANDIINNYFQDAQLDLGRHTYEDLNLYYALMEIYKIKIKYLKFISDLVKDPAFEYINREELLKNICPEINFPTTVKYSFKENKSETSYQFPKSFPKDSCNLNAINELLKSIYIDVKEIDRKAQKIVERYKKQSQLNEQEEKLLELRDSIFFYFDENNKELNQFHKTISDKIITNTNLANNEYASLKLESKIDEIDNFISCFEDYIYLYKSFLVLPKKVKRIEEDYTKTTWNPYTFTDMDEIVKERFYKAYEEIILPHLLKDINQTINCFNVKNKIGNFDTLYVYMINSREIDTKEKERQLRRVNKFDEANIIMKIDLKFD